MRMANQVMLVGVFLLIASGAFAADGFVLQLTPVLLTHKSGSAVDVVVTIENHSAAQLEITEWGDVMDYSIAAKDAKGVQVPLTVFGRRCRDEPQAGSVVETVRVAPEQCIRRVLRISKFLDLTEPDRYTIALIGLRNAKGKGWACRYLWHEN